MRTATTRASLAWISVLAAACGCAARAQSDTEPSPPTPTAERLSGTWSWNHSEDRDGVRRIEREVWTLRVNGSSLAGEYRRSATLMSLSGQPFECNQHLVYELVTVYRVEGVVGERDIDVKETSYETVPSPCESNFRVLGAYKGQLVGKRLRLSFDGGSQTLSRTDRAPPPLQMPKATAAGSWKWQNRSMRGSDQQVRVELEQWELTESKAGELSGTYLRTVTVFDESGSVFDCSGDTYYRYRDRYTVRGSRDGARVLVSEIAVDAESHGCNSSDSRHLDTARGEVVGDYIVLAWRGRNRQVLHR